MTIRTKTADALAYLERKARGNMTPEETAAAEQAAKDAAAEQAAKDAAAEQAAKDAAAEPETAEELPEAVPAHDHKWKRGVLPGQKYIKTCSVNGCGATEDVSLQEWQQLG